MGQRREHRAPFRFAVCEGGSMPLDNSEGSASLSQLDLDELGPAANLLPPFIHGSAAQFSFDTDLDRPSGFSRAKQPTAANTYPLRVLCVGCNMFQYGLIGMVREFVGDTDVTWIGGADEMPEQVGTDKEYDIVLLYAGTADPGNVTRVVESAPGIPV